MSEKYNHIISKLKEAKEIGNVKIEKLWKNKLTKWQMEYGAYAPVTHTNVHRYE